MPKRVVQVVHVRIIVQMFLRIVPRRKLFFLIDNFFQFCYISLYCYHFRRIGTKLYMKHDDIASVRKCLFVIETYFLHICSRYNLKYTESEWNWCITLYGCIYRGFDQYILAIWRFNQNFEKLHLICSLDVITCFAANCYSLRCITWYNVKSLWWHCET